MEPSECTVAGLAALLQATLLEESLVREKLGLASRFCEAEGCQDVQEIAECDMVADFVESLGTLGRAQKGRLKKRLQQM